MMPIQGQANPANTDVQAGDGAVGEHLKTYRHNVSTRTRPFDSLGLVAHNAAKTGLVIVAFPMVANGDKRGMIRISAVYHRLNGNGLPFNSGMVQDHFYSPSVLIGHY
jgi:hypothetical protein